MRFFIKLAYRGTNYSGWQRQPNDITVQQVIEDAMGKILRHKVALTGCGRTDAGVHSSEYFAHFELDSADHLNQDFMFHLNCCLPSDIVIYDIWECDKHARFDAISREYKYLISSIKEPFNLNQVWEVRHQLDKQLMQVAASKLLNYSDFTSFSKTGSDNKTNICTIMRADWEFCEKRATFTIVADRFLRSMVRSIVGALVDVGRGRLSVEQFEATIEAKERNGRCSLAPADGLFLTKIKYD